MLATDIVQGKAYSREDGTIRKVREIRADRNCKSGLIVLFDCWGGPNPKAKPGTGFSDIDLFADLSVSESSMVDHSA